MGDELRELVDNAQTCEDAYAAQCSGEERCQVLADSNSHRGHNASIGELMAIDHHKRASQHGNVHLFGCAAGPVEVQEGMEKSVFVLEEPPTIATLDPNIIPPLDVSPPTQELNPTTDSIVPIAVPVIHEKRQTERASTP